VRVRLPPHEITCSHYLYRTDVVIQKVEVAMVEEKNPPVRNIFAGVPKELPYELFEGIIEMGTFRLERIVSRGHSSLPGFWYDQVDNEWVILLQGRAGLRFQDMQDVMILEPGDYVHIARHRQHRVEWTEPNQETVWLALHYQ